MKKLVSRFATYVFSVTAKMIFLQFTHTQDRKPRISVHKSQQKRWHILCPSNSLYKASDSEEFHESFMMTISNFFFLFSLSYIPNPRIRFSYVFFSWISCLEDFVLSFLRQVPSSDQHFAGFTEKEFWQFFFFYTKLFLFRVWKKCKNWNRWLWRVFLFIYSILFFINTVYLLIVFLKDEWLLKGTLYLNTIKKWKLYQTVNRAIDTRFGIYVRLKEVEIFYSQPAQS